MFWFKRNKKEKFNKVMSEGSRQQLENVDHELIHKCENSEIDNLKKQKIKELLTRLSFTVFIERFMDNEIVITPTTDVHNYTFMDRARQNGEYLKFAELSYFAGISVVNQNNKFCFSFKNNIALLLLHQIRYGVAVSCKISPPSSKFQISIYNIDYDLLLSQLEQIELERIEEARIEKERIEKERIEKERIEKQRIEKERIEEKRRKDLYDNRFFYINEIICHYHKNGISIAPGPITLGKGAFAGRLDLREVYLPDTIKYIEDEAFSECSSLEVIHLPDSLEHIGSRAFFNCRKLKEITLPDSISLINARTFQDCINLMKVTFPKALSRIDTEAFKNCKGLIDIQLPNTIKIIGEYAFSGCSIDKLNLLSDNLAIGCGAFSCKGLKEVIINGSKVTGNNCFKGCTNLSDLYVHGPEIPLKFDLSCFKNLYITKSVKSFSSKVFISKNLKSLGNYSYLRYNITCHIEKNHEHFCVIDGVIYNKECTKLLSYPILGDEVFTIPDTVVSIEEFAFSCTNVKQINIPASVMQFSESALFGCGDIDIIVKPGSFMEGVLNQQKELKRQYDEKVKAVRYLMKPGNVSKSYNTRHSLLGYKE